MDFDDIEHTGNTEAMRYYAALEGASREMLEAARNGDWDNVCRLEGACAVVIAKLRQVMLESPLAQADQPERMRILKAIVANDAEIRRLSHPLPAFLDPRAFQVEASATVH
jgi:flagellar protein FliT